MPPQQAYGLLDFVDNIFDFSPHCPASCSDGMCAVNNDARRLCKDRQASGKAMDGKVPLLSIKTARLNRG
jgi:hypothetical protein